MLARGPRRGPLRGVPVVIKDEWPLPWRAQRFGSAETAGADGAGRVRPLPRPARRRRGDRRGRQHGRAGRRAAPAAISVYGPAHNPWDPERCPGGSSSGPAAAVAARLVAGAVGADGLGSVRYPAAYCGLTGLKPTFGRSAMDGHHAAELDDDDRLRPALRRRRRLPAARPRRSSARSWRAATRPAPDRRRPRRRRPRTSTPRCATPARRRSRCCARRPAARSGRSQLPDLDDGDDGGDPDRQQRRPRRGHPGAAQPSQPRDQPDQPRRAQVPDADPAVAVAQAHRSGR